MKRRWFASTALAGLLVAAGGLDAAAQGLDFDETFVFGDSLSDTGSRFAQTGGRTDPTDPNVEPSIVVYNTAFPGSLVDPGAGTPTERFTNGTQNHIDIIAGDLTNVVGSFDPDSGAQTIPGTPLVAPVNVNPGLTFDPAETGTDGFNFAHGGAESGLTNAAGENIGFLSQIQAFATLQAGGQLRVDENDAAVVFVGGNDFFNAAQTGSLGESTVETALQNVGLGLNTLAGSGVDNIVVYNLPDLSDVPLGQELAAAADAQQAGQGQALLTGLQQLTTVFNAELRGSVVAPLEQQGVDVTVVDVQALFDDIARQPAAYGLRDASTHCFSLVTQAPTGDCQTAEDVAETTFLDSLHPSAAGQQIIAQFAQGSQFTQSTAPSVYATLPSLAHLAADGHNAIIDSRLRAVRAGLRGVNFMGAQLPGENGTAGSEIDSKLSVFVYGNYNDGDRPAATGTAGFDYDQTLVTAGADYEVNDTLLLGVSAGFSQADGDLAGNLGDVEVDSTIFSVYGTASLHGFYGDLTATVSLDEHEIDRRTQGPLGGANAETNGQTFGVAFNGGYRFERNNLSFGPTVGMRFLDTEIENFDETGAGALNLDIDDLNSEAVIGSIGAQAAGRFTFGEGNVIAPQAGLTFEHDFKNDSFDVATTLPGNNRSVSEASIDRDDAFVLDGGVTVGLKYGLSASVGGRVSLARDGSDRSVRGRLRYTF